MKKMLFLATLLSFSFLLFSQVGRAVVAPEDPAFDLLIKGAKVPKVKGRLLNISSREIAQTFINYTLVTPFSEFQVKKVAIVNKDGSFTLQIDYPLPYQQIWFSVGEYFYAGLLVNKGLNVELDVKKLKSQKEVSFYGEGVRFSGVDGPLNTYYNKYIVYRQSHEKEIQKKLQAILQNRNLSDTVFVQQYSDAFQDLKAVEDSFIAAKPSPYSWVLANERLSEYYSNICVRFWNKRMPDSLWSKLRDHRVFMVSNQGMLLHSYITTYIRSLPANRIIISTKELLLLPDLTADERAAIDSMNKMAGTDLSLMKSNLSRYKETLAPRTAALLAQKTSMKVIHSLDSIFSPSKADFLKLHLGSKDPTEQKIFYEAAEKSMQTSWTKNIVKAEYNRTLLKINEINDQLANAKDLVNDLGFGQPLLKTGFDAKLYKIPNMNAKGFLAKLKQSFGEKAILLDFWATWCSPCLAEMPYGKKLHNDSKELPIVFVYLCTTSGSDEMRWKSKVVELKQPGVHLYVDEALVNELMGLFSFSGYPSYAFIDKKGIYKPGAIEWMHKTDKNELIRLLNIE